MCSMQQLKNRRNMRLTAEAWRLATEMAAQLGLTRTAIFELAIREMAERRGLAPKDGEAPRPHRQA